MFLGTKAVLLAFVMSIAAVMLLQAPARAQSPAPTNSDLSITKAGPDTVEPGQSFEYVLTVTNAQNAAAATSVTVTDVLPDGVTFIGSDPAICAAPDGRTVNCTIPSLAPGQSRTITLNVRAPLTAGPITNRASVSADNEPDSPVNSNPVTTNVVPNLTIDKLDDPDPVTGVEDILLYTIRVQNRGDTFVSGVAITDTLPLDVLDFVEVESDDYECQYTAGVVQCNAERPFGPGEISTVQIVVEPEVAGTIQNTGALFVQGIRGPLKTDTEYTLVEESATDEEDEDPDDGDGTNDGNNDNGDDDNSGGNDSNSDNGEDSGVIKETVPDKELPDTGGATREIFIGVSIFSVFVVLLKWISSFKKL